MVVYSSAYFKNGRDWIGWDGCLGCVGWVGGKENLMVDGLDIVFHPMAHA